MVAGLALEDAVYTATESGQIMLPTGTPTPTLAPDAPIATGSAEATPSATPVPEQSTASTVQTGTVKIAVSPLWHAQPASTSDLMTSSTSLDLTADMVTFDKPVAMYNDLNVLGNSVFNTITTTGNVHVGLLTLDSSDQSINAIGSTLSLQNKFGAGDLTIFGDKILMTTDGNIKTLGEVTAKKFNVDTQDVAGASAGKVTILAGEDFAIVETTALTPDSLIFVTPEKAVAIGSYKFDGTTFVIELDAPATQDLDVNWWIIN
jgi:hypothetical protein